MRTARSQTALLGASRNAEKAFQAVSDADLAHYPANEKTAWAMAAVIHCDFCRLVIAYEECEREGLARLLSMADISSKLVEARNWYNSAGSKLLKEIAASKQCGVEAVRPPSSYLSTVGSTFHIWLPECGAHELLGRIPSSKICRTSPGNDERPLFQTLNTWAGVCWH